ncbi:embryonic protein UVS.2-like [Hyla sarda]|uniref:embryonic protein UVS.2-like n=1 Tax=Hyla sarda TaxID=327740 RepID=UPI0024C42E7A|nr:embryonic protein UVS.2-like [Hyla sarda]
MNRSFPIILLACLVISASSLPLKVCKSRPKSGTNTGQENIIKRVNQPLPNVFAKIREINKGIINRKHQLIHGDILKREGRYAIDCESCLWPKSEDGTINVPYILDSIYTPDEQNQILTAMQEFNSLTCVRFVPRNDELSYLRILSEDGCASYAGQIGGTQPLQLQASYGCLYRGIIQHELNHALGFFHENARADRDQYIIINHENIANGYEPGFSIVDGNNLSLPYDYSSVMHFDKYAYTSNDLPTIKPTPDPNVPIGQRDGLSVLDVAKINKLYNCNVCSTLLNTPSGNFSSPNYPSNYPNNMNCVWLIRTPNGQVSLTFKDFRLLNSMDCASDYINIYDGPSTTSPKIVKLCGSKQLPEIIGSNNQMLIEFVSGSLTTSAGFSASYKTVQCGRTYFDATNIITSPGYSSGSYLPNLNCNYIINAQPGYRITITGNYEIEQTMYCKDDKLTIYSNGIVGSPKYLFCGKGSLLVKSLNNTLLMNFQSDPYYHKKGFNLTYWTYQ